MKLSLTVKLVSAATIIFLVAGFISLPLLVYSAVQISVSPGNATTEIAGSAATFTVPIRISNNGFLAVKALTLQITVFDRNESLLQSNTGPIDVPPGAVKDVPVAVPLDLKTLKPQTLRRLALNNENLTVNLQGSVGLEPMISLSFSGQTVFSWSAPIQNFAVGQPTFAALNSTAFQASIPIGFVNNSPYIPVSGRVTVSLYDQANSLQGTGTLNVSAPTGSHYQKSLVLPVKLPANLQSLMFNDTALNYRVDATCYIGDAQAFNLSQPVDVSWGAPFKNLEIGTPTFQPLNLTHVSAAVPFNFTNNSPFISLSASVRTEFYNSTGSLVGSGSPIQITAPAGTFYKGQITGQVKTSASSGTIRMRIIFTTTYGTFIKEVTLGA